MTSNIGFEVTLNASNQYEFDIITGVDRSKDNGVVTPVILDPDMDNVKTMQLEDSDIGRVNFGYIAGQGEGVDREIYRTGSDDLYEVDTADEIEAGGTIHRLDVVDGNLQIMSYPTIQFDGSTGYIDVPDTGN